MQHPEDQINEQENKNFKWAVVVAQLGEWSLLTPQIRGSNPIISKKKY